VDRDRRRWQASHLNWFEQYGSRAGAKPGSLPPFNALNFNQRRGERSRQVVVFHPPARVPSFPLRIQRQQNAAALRRRKGKEDMPTKRRSIFKPCPPRAKTGDTGITTHSLVNSVTRPSSVGSVPVRLLARSDLRHRRVAAWRLRTRHSCNRCWRSPRKEWGDSKPDTEML
jgi:hypothetical protein